MTQGKSSGGAVDVLAVAAANDAVLRRLAQFSSGSVFEIGLDVSRELRDAGLAFVTSDGDVCPTALGRELGFASIVNELVTVEVQS